jgi:hypothetical protein|tara:strand:+ start:244 stop:804 length:561 start_codon:yes stop_codon:yes gene_type:complete
MNEDNGDDEKTRIIQGVSEPQKKLREGQGGDDEKTRIIGGKGSFSSGDDEKTKVFRKSSPKEEDLSLSDDVMMDPPVGWLVLISGPGKGNFLTLGYGQNTIGRGENVRLKLDFGDTEISREPNAVVTYDPKSRKFYLSPGTGQNLTYLNEEPILSPTIIESGAKINLGQTSLRLAEFCDEKFDWQD